MSAVKLSCPNSDCGKRLSLPLDLGAGPRTVRCPICKTMFTIALAPPADDLVPLESAGPRGFSLDDLDEGGGGSYGLAEENSLVFLLRREQDGFKLTAEEKATRRRLIDEALEDSPRRCPACEGKLARGAVLCVACGLNMKTGKRLKTTVETAETQSEDNGMLRKAEAAGAVVDLIVTILGSGG